MLLVVVALAAVAVIAVIAIREALFNGTSMSLWCHKYDPILVGFGVKILSEKNEII